MIFAAKYYLVLMFAASLLLQRYIDFFLRMFLLVLPIFSPRRTLLTGSSHWFFSPRSLFLILSESEMTNIVSWGVTLFILLCFSVSSSLCARPFCECTKRNKANQQSPNPDQQWKTLSAIKRRKIQRALVHGLDVNVRSSRAQLPVTWHLSLKQ